MEGNRDIVVIGGSVGAIDVVSSILDGIPDELNAAIFVVIHTGLDTTNAFPDIFRPHTKLPVNYASDREPIELGRVYIAPVDRHLLIKAGEVRVVHGPKENNFRPAIDPLFRSAAATYDGRVIGVVITGGLDDGTHGLLQIKRGGGTAIVQSPEEATQRGMPDSAIRRVHVDYIRPAAQIGPLIAELVSKQTNVREALGEDEADVSEGLISALRVSSIGAPTTFTCPECNGSLWEIKDGEMTKYRCHVGHGYGVDTLLADQATKIEQALWSAVRGFEERAALQKRTAGANRGNPEIHDRLRATSREQQQMADLLRSILVRPGDLSPEKIGERFRNEYQGNGGTA